MEVTITRTFVLKRIENQKDEVSKFMNRHWKKHVTNERKFELAKSAVKQLHHFQSLLQVMDENNTNEITF